MNQPTSLTRKKNTVKNLMNGILEFWHYAHWIKKKTIERF